MTAADSTVFAPPVASGELRVLCPWGEQRLARFPEVPQLKELGLPIVQACPCGLGAPKGMEPALATRIHDAFKAAMKMPARFEALAHYDQQLLPMSPQQDSRFAEETFKRKKALVETFGLAKPT